MSLVKTLRHAATARAENERVAGFGPGGGNPAARAEHCLEWVAADEIETMQNLLQEVYDWNGGPTNWSLPDELKDRIFTCLP